jgi:arylsulfatase A
MMSNYKNDKQIPSVSRRSFLRTLGAGIAGSCLYTFASAYAAKVKEKAEDKPNILLIFADDIGYEALNCYGGLDFKTPHLDTMASQGVRFGRAYTSPLCTPSRVSMHTGLYTRHHGQLALINAHLGTKDKVDFQKLTTYAQLMRANGYATSVTGKWQLATIEVWPDHIHSAGFDSWCVWQIWYKEQKSLRHWNATYNHDGRVMDDIADRFGPDVLAEYVINQMKAAKEAGKPFLIVHNELLPHFPIIDTPDDRKKNRKASLGNMIEYMDKLAGQLLVAVKSLGIRDNTYVVFMGDNGTQEEYFNNPRAGQPNEKPHTRHTIKGSVNGGKFELNDAGTHVPLIVWGPPSVPKGKVCDDLVDIVDLFPTFCELSGTSISGSVSIDGRSLVPQFHGLPGTARNWTHQATQEAGESVFDGSWRLNKKGDVLLDARNLPIELPADPADPQAAAAKARLKAVFQEVSKMS